MAREKRTGSVKNSLLWKLLGINVLIIGFVIAIVWLSVDYLAADYFVILMEKYHISPTSSHEMFVGAIHRYLVWASLAAVFLAVVLSLALPDRLRLLNAALVALVGIGIAFRKQGREPLAGQAFVQVGLSWLAGTLVFSDVRGASLALALTFGLTTWGALRLGRGLAGGLWLLNGGLITSVVIMVVAHQPLAAGLMGLLFFGQLATEISLGHREGSANAHLCDRTGPWLMCMMLVAALAVP